MGYNKGVFISLTYPDVYIVNISNHISFNKLHCKLACLLEFIPGLLQKSGCTPMQAGNFGFNVNTIYVAKSRNIECHSPVVQN